MLALVNKQHYRHLFLGHAYISGEMAHSDGQGFGFIPCFQKATFLKLTKHSYTKASSNSQGVSLDA